MELADTKAVVDTHGSAVKKPKQLVDTGRSGNAMEKANMEQMETDEIR
jgi:hypothetical protein